jgi:nitrilase
MKIAAIQMVSTPDVGRNLDSAQRLLAEASAAGARIAALPEYFCLMGLRDGDKLAIAEEPGNGPIQHSLARWANELQLWIVGGTLPLRVAARDDRVYNSSLVFSPDGRCAARYDKVHLFAFDNGTERYDEGVLLQPGSRPSSVEVSIGPARLRVGLSVCYDLRFPELYRALSPRGAAQPCDLICVPSAFTFTTGQAHWELLLRARAVENQCYVLAPAQGGRHESGRRTWGHSLIVDPWGEVLACRRDEGEGIVAAEFDDQRLSQIRRQLPALAHRRLA